MEHFDGGYQCNVSSSNSSVLRLVDEGRYALNPGVTGSSIIHNWTFAGDNTGTTTLTFNESRSWLGNDSIINTFILNVTTNAGDSKTTIWPIIIVVAVVIIVGVPATFYLLKLKSSK